MCFRDAFRRFRLNQGVAARVSGGCFRSIGLSDLTDLADKPGARASGEFASEAPSGGGAMANSTIVSFNHERNLC